MERFRTPIIIALLIAISAGGITFLLRQNTTSCPIEIVLPPPSQEIEVYVSGEVQNPGVFILSEGARVADALRAAGGLTTDADQSAINQARKLRDGVQVHVPQMGESSQRININTADVWLLDALPGIGETLAERIIEFRIENGPFESIDDLKKVKGIRKATFEKIEDKITVR